MTLLLQKINNKPIYLKFLISLALFALALSVRLPGLGTFMVGDEDTWIKRSQVFLNGILDPNYDCPFYDTDAIGTGLACTLRTGHPGVITMWTGAAGITMQWLIRPASDMRTLLEFTKTLPTLPVSPEVMTLARFPTVLISSLFVVALYWLLMRLFNPSIAFLASVLLALDPFHVALSRVLHHDALSTTFIVTGALSLAIYFGVDHRRRWMILGGILAGIALLSKSTGLFLIPYAGLLGLWFLVRQCLTQKQNCGKNLLGVVLDGATWMMVLVITFVAIWPAMWVIPRQALHTIFATGFEYANQGHSGGVFFFGETSKNPGIFFYPITWLFRTMPWQLIGVGIMLLMPVWTFKHHMTSNASTRQTKRRWRDWVEAPFAFENGKLWWIVAFIVFFLIFMTLGAKKQDRYLLPFYPMMDIVAAVGLWHLIQWQSIKRGILIALILLVNGGLLLHTLPYAYAYANPLMGGGAIASRVVSMGWGEGLDQAASYLNQKPSAAELTVAAWYSWQFAPYFEGKTVDLASNEPAYNADYTVFYINQIQRRFPSEELLDYFADRVPEKTITLKGIDYAWIYPGIISKVMPHGVNYPLWLPLNEAITLQGIEHACDGITTTTCPITLYWQANDSLPADLNASIRVVDDAGLVWGQVDRLPIGGVIRTDKWETGSVIRDEYKLHLDPAMPAGDYTFDILLYDFKSGDVFAKASHVGRLSVGDLSAGDDTFYDYQPRGDFEAVELAKGLMLENHTFKDYETLPGYPRYFKSYWQADGTASVQFIARQGDTELMLGESEILASDTMRGQTDRIVFPAAATAGNYEIFARAKSSEARLGTVTLLAQSHSFEIPVGIERTEASFGDAIDLAGYELSRESGIIDLKLYWQPKGTPQDNLKVFVHVTDADGNIIAQRDAIPASGARPTQTWVSGEVIADEYRIPIEGKTDGVWVGMYNPLTGERVVVSSGTLPVSDNRLQIK